jgi:hypothetical protein
LQNYWNSVTTNTTKLKPPNHNAAATFPEAVIPDAIIAKYIILPPNAER